MKSYLLCTLIVLLLLCQNAYTQTKASDLVFNIQVTTTTNTPSITLKWNTQVGISAYSILKKNRNCKTFTLLASNIPQNDTIYTDWNVSVGAAYEYCIQGASNVNVSGYVYAGIELPEVHQTGEILLLVDSTYQQSAMFELEGYKLDLIKEGWKLSTTFVGRNQSVSSIKQIIQDKYDANPTNFKGVILLGHVPIPYSGNIAPDAHPDHIGAWPCDMYYANLNNPGVTNIWTDATLNTIAATSTRNHNVPSDGKFDASNKPTSSAVKIFVGRIDVYDMPAINADDVFLFKQYLAKNHDYRAGIKKFRNASIVDDNFGYFSGEAFAQNGWRNFSSLLGASNIEEGDYVSGTKLNTYMWSYACGPGWYTGSQGVGTTSDFTSNQMQSVFTMTYGSYFGDWDNQNNFLRAPIASPSSALVSIWGGRPNWFLHTMAMGEPIGYSYINSVDNGNSYFPKGYYSNKIHQSLLGDPTLKMYMFDAPTRVLTSSIDNDTKVKVQWTASPDPTVLGYYIYRANDVHDQFTLLNANYVTGNEFIDQSQGFNVAAVYMVRAVKLEQSTSGTFYNLSPGSMSLENPVAISLPVTITTFNGIANTNHTNSLYWEVNNEVNVSHYIVERAIDGTNFIAIGTVQAKQNGSKENNYSFVDTKPSGDNNYRLRSVDIDSKYAYSNIVNLKSIESVISTNVYPSPFSNNLYVTYASDKNESKSIKVQDINGRILLNKHLATQIGENTITLTELSQLPKGLYILTVFNDDAETKSVFKILKE